MRRAGRPRGAEDGEHGAHPEKPELFELSASASPGTSGCNATLASSVPSHRTAALRDNSYTEMEHHMQGQVVFNGWTSVVPKGRAAAGRSGRDGAKSACETPEKEDRQA